MNEKLPQTITSDFRSKAAREPDDPHIILYAIDRFMADMDRYQCEADTRCFGAEEHIRESFEAFLKTCDFQMAQKEFETLLAETDGKFRNDDTVVWFHQLSAIMIFLSAVGNGKIQLSNLEGGLETALRTHLRHDSIEDTKLTFKKFGKQITRYAKEELDFSPARREREFGRNAFVYNGVVLMTKKKAIVDPQTNEVMHDPDTHKVLKEDLFPNNKAYMYNMLVSSDALGQVWILKQLDVIHNQGTIETPKFGAQKRLEKCVEIEDMFGPRLGMAYAASQKWPEFSEAIESFDALMASLVYLNFGALEYVDLAYQDDPNKFKEGEPIYPLAGVGKFLQSALDIDIPRGFHPLHIWLERIEHKRKYHEDPEVRKRTDAFLKHAVYPVLEPHKTYFPRIFAANDHGATDLDGQSHDCV